MSGPIVRTGTTPKFWENWDNVFSKGKSGGKKGSGKPAPKAAVKTGKKAGGPKK